MTNYQVYKADGVSPADSDFAFVADTGLTQTYAYTDVVAGNEYSFKCRASNIVGNGAFSDYVSQMAASVSDAPIALTLIS